MSTPPSHLGWDGCPRLGLERLSPIGGSLKWASAASRLPHHPCEPSRAKGTAPPFAREEIEGPAHCPRAVMARPSTQVLGPQLCPRLGGSAEGTLRFLSD